MSTQKVIVCVCECEIFEMTGDIIRRCQSCRAPARLTSALRGNPGPTEAVLSRWTPGAGAEGVPAPRLPPVPIPSTLGAGDIPSVSGGACLWSGSLGAL